jgi:hypothetical protein
LLVNGNATSVTIGRATGIFSLVRDDDTAEESMEWATYNYINKSGVFSAPGDSGSIIVDGLGRIGPSHWRYWQDGDVRYYLRHPYVVALALYQERHR